MRLRSYLVLVAVAAVIPIVIFSAATAFLVARELRAPHDGHVRRSIATTLGAGVLAAGAGAGLALVLGRRLARPIRQLSAGARALGRGHEPALPSTTGLAELDEVRRELMAASGRLRQSEGEREAVTAQLRAEEARYRGIFENTPLIVSLWAPDGTVLDVNRRVEAILGWTRQELIGRRWVEVTLPPSERHGAAPIVERILSSPAGAAHVSTYVAKDGREVVCEWYTSPLYDAEGRLTALISLGHDVTERRRAEEALRRSEAVLRQVIDVIPHLIYAEDRHGRLVFANQRYAEMAGVPLADLVGRPLVDFIPVESEAQGFLREDREVLDTGQPKVIPEHIRTDHQGVVHILHTTKVPFRPVGSDETAVLGVSIDVTDLRRVEERLRLLSRAIEQNPVAIMITDRAGAIVYVNPTFTAVTGYAAEEVIGQNPRFLKSGEHDVDFYRELWGTITAGQDWRGKLRNRKKSGELYWVASSISPVTDAAGRITHFVALDEDVTEHQHLEEQLRQAQRMEAVGLLAGGVAHDFNNLLTVIGGYAQMTLDELPPTAVLRPRIEQIMRASARAAGLTRQLLAFSRQLPAQPRVLDVNATLGDMQRMLRRLIGEDVTLRLEFGEHLGQVRMDPGHIEQMVMNLTVNARDAMRQGGVLTVETGNVTLDPVEAGAALEVPPGRYVRLSVRDTGIGMDAATRARIFEPFFTTKEIGKGTGLGLSTVYGIVKQAGGGIRVESEPGQGARFDIYLPRVDEPVETAAPAPDLPVPGGPETVLLVEDDDDVRALMGHVLRACGYTVLESRHPGEALLVVERHPEVIHLLVTDVVMPQMRGWELATRARVLRPDLRVVYVSGYPGDDGERPSLETVDFLAKPVTPTTLALKVREVLDRPD